MIWELKLHHIMNRSTMTFLQDTKIEQAMSALVQHRYSGAPVVGDHGKILGMLSQKDCLKAIVQSQYHETVGGVVADYMTSPVETLDADMGLFEVAQRFINSSYRRFPVMDDNKMVGIVTRFDLLKAIEERPG